MKLTGKLGRNGDPRPIKNDLIVTPLQLRVQYIKKDGSLDEDIVLCDTFGNINQERLNQAILSQEIVSAIVKFGVHTSNGRAYQKANVYLPKDFYHVTQN